MPNAVQIPKFGEEKSCVIVKWEKKVGDQVRPGDVLLTFETANFEAELESEYEGELLGVFFEEGEKVPSLVNICVVGQPGEDIEALRPDVNAIRAEMQGAVSEVAENEDEESTEFIKPETAYEDIPFNAIRRTISASMYGSLSSTAQLTHNFSFDASNLLAYRKTLKLIGGGLEEITVGNMILYTVSRVLLSYPDMNAHMLDANTIRHFKEVNLGVAVDTPRGLLVPTVFHANKKSLLEISREVNRLAKEARKGNIHPDKLTEGTLTVTNLGSFGVESFTPVLNPPQTAIIGVCTTVERTRTKADGKTEQYPAMTLSLTYDHRAVDGAPASRFMQEVCQNLEHFTDFLKKEEACAEFYDLMVIGGGPGGYLCAERAAQGGMKVALFEKKHLGGTCLNEGCVPTKTLLNSAKLYRHATESAIYGVTAENVSFDHAQAIKRKNSVVNTLVSGVAATMQMNQVNVIPAAAEITEYKEGCITITANGQTYKGAKLVFATGSEAVFPPIPGAKEGLECGFVVTNREILSSTTLPKELVVIGGGVIGLEMACYYASVGVHVTVIEALPKIAGPIDSDICAVLMDTYKKKGMDFCLSSKVLEITNHSVIYEAKGEKKEAICDMVLLSVGRRPVSAVPGIEALGLTMDRTAILADSHLLTNVPGIYAIGDCNGKMMLAHTAYREAEAAVNHMLGVEDEMRYDAIPSVIYTDPEVAVVGESKASAEEKGMKVKEVKLPLAYVGRYVAENEKGKGFIKLVVDTENQRLVGCHIIGSYASEIIMTAAMMVDLELSPDRLKKLVFPHPTVSEAIREAIVRI